MREILFRGKRSDNCEWVEGFLLKECNYATCSWNLGIEYKTDRFGKFAYDVAEIIPYTVGQFTGLTDKNGKKIFEGDILAYRAGRLHIVKFEDGGFVLTGTAIPIRHADKFKVIGNIHDNNLEDFNGN